MTRWQIVGHSQAVTVSTQDMLIWLPHAAMGVCACQLAANLCLRLPAHGSRIPTMGA